MSIINLSSTIYLGMKEFSITFLAFVVYNMTIVYLSLVHNTKINKNKKTNNDLKNIKTNN